jgi:PAS domain S-box-containing protein
LSISAERRKLYDFASPTFTREFGLVVRSGEMRVRDAGDLKGKRVGVTAGGFPSSFLERQGGANLVFIHNYNDGLDRLAAGTIDAIAADVWVAAYLIEKRGIRGVAIVEKPFATARGAIAVKKGNLELASEISQAIRMLEKAGTISRIQDHWRSQEVVFASRGRIRGLVALATGAVLVILFAAMGIWILTLKKQIRIRRRAERALRESEERFQLAVRGSTDGLWDRNILTNEVFFTDHYRELLGYSADEFRGTFASFESRLHPEDRERVLKAIASHLEQRTPYDAEYRLRTKSGQYRWFRGRGQAIWNERGQAIRMAGSITDITDRKEAEQALRESVAEFRAIFENAAIGVSLANLAGRFVKCNPALQRLLGYTEAQLRERTFADVTHPDDAEADLQRYRALVRGEVNDYQIEKRCFRKDGQAVWVRLTVSLVSRPGGEAQFAIRMVEDISGRKQAEALTNAQMHVLEMITGGGPLSETLDTLLRMIESQSQEMLCSILLLDQDGVHIHHGAAPSLSEEYLKAIDGSTIGPCAGSCGTAAFRREPVFVADIATDPLWADYKHLALPHGLRACWSTPILDEQRKVLGTFAIYYRTPGMPSDWHLRLIAMATHTAAVCIAKHRADEALRNSEESLRATIENTPDVAVQWFDAQGRVKFWNRASQLLYGWTAVEAANQTLDQLIFGREQAEAFQRSLGEIAQTGKSVGPVEFPFHRRDGTPGIVLSTLFQIQIPSGEPRFVCMDVDLTERKAAEASLRQAQTRELRAREEFAQHLLTAQEQERQRLANELHDGLGQNLSIIKNRAHFALEQPGLPMTVSDHLKALTQVASEAIAEVRSLAQNLRPLHIEQLGLTDSLTGLIEQVTQATSIRIEHRLENVDDLFKGDAATQVYRVVQEALNNVLKHSQASRANVALERDVRCVRLRMEDDGRGFELQRALAQGGLGLTSISERARMLGGMLNIQSNPGAGTRLTIELPITDDADARSQTG